MRLSRLIGELIELAESLNPRDIDWQEGEFVANGFEVDPEVRLATQPTWPLAHNICSVTHIGFDQEEMDGLLDNLRSPDSFRPSEVVQMRERVRELEEEVGVVWVAEGSTCSDSPYAPRGAWS